MLGQAGHGLAHWTCPTIFEPDVRDEGHPDGNDAVLIVTNTRQFLEELFFFVHGGLP